MPDINMRYRNGEIDDDLPYGQDMDVEEDAKAAE